MGEFVSVDRYGTRMILSSRKVKTIAGGNFHLQGAARAGAANASRSDDAIASLYKLGRLEAHVVKLGAPLLEVGADLFGAAADPRLGMLLGDPPLSVDRQFTPRGVELPRR